jgi:hypothetical protein
MVLLNIYNILSTTYSLSNQREYFSFNFIMQKCHAFSNPDVTQNSYWDILTIIREEKLDIHWPIYKLILSCVSAARAV